MRKLGSDEATLWGRVARTVRPLKPEDRSAGNQEPEPPPLALDPIVHQRAPTRRKLGIGETLDGGWDRRLRDGRIDPDSTLDVHGMTLDEAWRAIDRLLDGAWTRGDRLVLLVTGRERSRPNEAEISKPRGLIRASVRDWLAASRHAPHIAAIRTAHLRHGGGGSLYLVLRRH